MSSLRAQAKQVVESLLGSAPAVKAALHRLRGARLVLSYHNVIAQDAPLARGDTSLHLPLSRFRAQLDAIAECGLEVATLDAPADPNALPRVVISFDDAYAGTLDVALPELERRAWPCTVFVAPGILGSEAPWWDRLAAPESGAIPPRVRDTALDTLAGEDARIVAAAATEGWALHAPLPAHRIASETELVAAIRRYPKLQVGSHTWSHPNVSRLSVDALNQELHSSREWLRERFDARYVNWLAYPYGLESNEARDAVVRAGYQGAFRVSGGWDKGTAPARALPRLNVTPGISDAGFRARLAGLL